MSLCTVPVFSWHSYFFFPPPTNNSCSLLYKKVTNTKSWLVFVGDPASPSSFKSTVNFNRNRDYNMFPASTIITIQEEAWIYRSKEINRDKMYSQLLVMKTNLNKQRKNKLTCRQACAFINLALNHFYIWFDSRTSKRVAELPPHRQSLTECKCYNLHGLWYSNTATLMEVKYPFKFYKFAPFQTQRQRLIQLWSVGITRVTRNLTEQLLE